MFFFPLCVHSSSSLWGKWCLKSSLCCSLRLMEKSFSLFLFHKQKENCDDDSSQQWNKRTRISLFDRIGDFPPGGLVLSWCWGECCTGTETSKSLSHLAALQFMLYYYSMMALTHCWLLVICMRYSLIILARGFGRFRMTAAPAWLGRTSIYWTNIYRKEGGKRKRDDWALNIIDGHLCDRFWAISSLSQLWNSLLVIQCDSLKSMLCAKRPDTSDMTDSIDAWAECSIISSLASSNWSSLVARG